MQAASQAIPQCTGTEADSVKKSVMKTMSWRVIATTVTFVIGWILTGKVLAEGAIASLQSSFEPS